MATQSTLYDLESTESRFFLSTKNIASKSHVAIWIKGDDDIYRIQNESDYELINDTIVYPAVPSGKALEVRVGDSPSDLVNAPTDISIVSAIANEIVIVADNVQDVVNVSNNIASITIVSDNMTELLVISDEIDLVLLSKEYAVNPEDVAITDNPSDFSSLHYSKKAEQSAEEAQAITDSINFPAGLIMEWNSDRKPSGWLWCDGEEYAVFSPTPSLAYDELYATLEDPEYVMTTKPEDWDANYPDDPNGWYDPAFAGSVVSQAELDLTVTVPDRRGVFVRGKDRHGSVGTTRGLDSHGVVALNAVIPSQIQDHTHNYLRYYYTNDDTISGSGHSANNSDQYNTQTTAGASGGATVGSETHGTYVTTNYIIRAKGSYNGDGTGSGGTGVVPIASEIDYSDTYGTGNTNLQDTTDDIFKKRALIKTHGGTRPLEKTVASTNGSSYTYAFHLAKKIVNGSAITTVYSEEVDGQSYTNKKTVVYDSNFGVLFTSTTTNTHTGCSGGINSSGQIMIQDPAQAVDSTTFKFLIKDIAGVTLHGGSYVIGKPLGNMNHLTFSTGLGSDRFVFSYRSASGSTYYDGVVIVENDGSTTMLRSESTSTPHYGGNGAMIYDDLGLVMAFKTDGTGLDIWDTKNLNSKTTKTLNVALGVSRALKPAGESADRIYFTDSFYIGTTPTLRYILKSDLETLTGSLDTHAVETVERFGAMDINQVYYSLAREAKTIYERNYGVTFPKEWMALKFDKTNEELEAIKDYSVSLHTTNDAVTYSGVSANADYSFISGFNLKSAFSKAVAHGHGLVTRAIGQSVFGRFNSTSTAGVTIGCGADEANRKDGITISTTGDVQAPNRLATPNDKSLVTADNYGKSTVGGTLKARLDGTVLYLTNDGTDA